jgi:quinoprotein glucose dehydrogenase
MRFSPLNQISRTNVRQLQRAWTYHTGETDWDSIKRGGRIAAFESTPLMVDGVLYFTTPAGRAIALDGETGKEIWVFDPFAGAGGSRRTLQNRGVAYWEGHSPVTCRGAANDVDRRIFLRAWMGGSSL